MNDALPVSALPDLLRGISRFRKSGVIEFKILIDDRYNNGNLYCFDGMLGAFALRDVKFSNHFLDRLHRGSLLPDNVFEVLKESDLEAEDLLKLLYLEPYLSDKKVSCLYSGAIEEFLFSILSSRSGTVQFQALRSDLYSAFVSNEDLEIIQLSRAFQENPDNIIKGQQNSISEHGIYPCQLLLDYVETELVRREISQGEAYLFTTASSTQLILLDHVERSILRKAEAEISLGELINSVADSRRVIFELVRKLKADGALAIEEKRSEDKSSHAMTTDYIGSSIPIKEGISDKSEKIDTIELGILEKLDTYLLSPEGIEWILWRVFIPFVILSICFGFKGVITFMDEIRLFING
ncbi:MAG TPA: hypothetical protein PKA63_00840 [Oligoflexia bacterium]|nr:hypothetical protein [Oligoflexia bacterium]HMP47196.1 hypothetical protein [Oligoflexia bacterium]